MRDKSIIDLGQGDDPLDSDAVLPRALKDAPHQYASHFFQVLDIVEHDCGILAAKLDAEGCEGFGC